MIKLKYGNTNTFFIQGSGGGLLFDTDYAGTLPLFYKALKQNNIGVKDIGYVLASHYHPDHMGLIGELIKQGAKLLLIDVQKDFIHFSDSISLILDDGDCLVGDLDPFEYIEAYEENATLRADWDLIASFHPETVFYAHRPELHIISLGSR